MTERQFSTIAALIMALIATQILCATVLMRSMECTRKEAEAARLDVQQILQRQKALADAPTIQAQPPTIYSAARVAFSHWPKLRDAKSPDSARQLTPAR